MVLLIILVVAGHSHFAPTQKLNEAYPYLRYYPVETDFPLTIIGSNSLVAHTPIMSLVFNSLASISDFGAETESNYTQLIKELIQCESGGNEKAVGDNGKSRGILQFRKATYEMFCDGYWLSSDNQIKCAEKMIELGLGDKEIGWVNCFRKLNLNRYLQ